jgi:hypothetical protein
LKAWLFSYEIEELSADVNWPTVDSHEMWNELRRSFAMVEDADAWQRTSISAPVEWFGTPPAPQTPLRFLSQQDEGALVLNEELAPIGKMPTWKGKRQGMVLASADGIGYPNFIDFDYIGPGDWF